MTEGAQEIVRRIHQEHGEIDAESIAGFRTVLVDNPEGKQVLTWLLSVLGFFSNGSASQEEALLQDIAKLILARCGVWHGERMYEIVDAIVALPGVVPEYMRNEE